MREQALRTLVAGWSLLLLTVHLYASTSVGFGDSEALYATYSLHPQVTYVDHPGAVGLAFSVLGRVPSRVHLVTSFLFLLDTFLFYQMALALGAKEKRALAGTFVFATVPALSVGLFALTPDALLCPLWLLLTAAFARALAGGKELRWIFAASLASFVKVTFVPLAFAMAVASYLRWRSSQAERNFHAAPSLRPLKLLAALLPMVFLFALDRSVVGADMFHHRLFEHDAKAVAWWTGVPKTLFGQLLYLGPVAAVSGTLCLVSSWRSLRATTRQDALRLLFVIPFAILLTGSLLTPHSEPHWLTPAWISLLLWLSVDDEVTPLASNPRVVQSIVVTNSVLSLLAHVWILVPIGPRFIAAHDLRYDIANELYGWPVALGELSRVRTVFPGAVVVTPHWVLSAQIASALGERVGSNTPMRDDFDRWASREEWRHTDTQIWLFDGRFEPELEEVRSKGVIHQSNISTYRGGRLARTFKIVVVQNGRKELPAKNATE